MDSEVLLVWKGNIPTDLLIDILLRLPAKSIVKCMSTCKKWYSLIRSVQFIRSHRNYSKFRNQSILIVKKGSFSIFHESDMTLIEQESGRIPFPVIQRDFYILGSCKGLILLRLRVEHGWLVLLWNPSLQKFKRIDSVLYYSPRDSASTVAWSCVFALGFHEEDDDYRVVRIVRTPGKEVVDVYSLATDNWNRVVGTIIDGSILPAIVFSEKMTIYLNGAVHWIAYYTKKVHDYHVILSFDFENEVFKVIELPERYTTYVEEFYSLDLTEFNGKLALFGVYLSPWDYPTFTCVMMNYPFVESWTDLGILFEFEEKENIWPIVCTKKGNCVFRPIRSPRQGMLMYYNTKENKIYDLQVMTPYTSPVIVDFIECLVLLDVEKEGLDYHKKYTQVT